MAMRSPDYDLVLPLGGKCSCAQVLQKRGLRLASYPFDWLYGSNLRGRTDLVMKGFCGWLEKGDLRERPPVPWNDKAIYENTVTGLGYSHDFLLGQSLDEQYPDVKAKYDRRIARLLQNLSAAKRTLLFWIQVPAYGRIPEGDLDYCLQAFRRRYPENQVDLLAFDYAAGVPVENRETECRDGITVIRFDYRNYEHPQGEYEVRQEILASLLKGIRVADSRSREERRRYAQACRLREYGKYGAESWLGYVVLRSQYKLFCHLRKSLLRHGVKLEGGRHD